MRYQTIREDFLYFRRFVAFTNVTKTIEYYSNKQMARRLDLVRASQSKKLCFICLISQHIFV